MSEQIENIELSPEQEAEVQRRIAEELAKLPEITVEESGDFSDELRAEFAHLFDEDGTLIDWKAKYEEIMAEREALDGEIKAYEQRKIDSRFLDEFQRQGVTPERAEKLLEFAKIIHSRQFPFDTFKDDRYIKNAVFNTIMDLGKKDAKTTKYIY
ncbi:hypothetical protein JOD03_002555 [Chryseomicrobium aureum]|uniref:hypothetical protein n=1 Tax=Chryseomicrobium aureum TaxID=1441723 RepID=UPI00195B74AC|nr:hypothetical protein [Chryseomicrobium aureum]MBM7707608.1 hypothetical protein [Chryseomicrobium aureum]